MVSPSATKNTLRGRIYDERLCLRAFVIPESRCYKRYTDLLLRRVRRIRRAPGEERGTVSGRVPLMLNRPTTRMSPKDNLRTSNSAP
jgi:hypothetical protein